MRRLSGAGYGSYLENQVEDFPAFILVDDKGNDFFQKSSTNSARTALSNLFGPAPGACCQVIPLGHLFCDCNFTLMVNSQYFP